jgi:hypothetical protein
MDGAHPWDIQVHKENGEPATFTDYGRRIPSTMGKVTVDR